MFSIEHLLETGAIFIFGGHFFIGASLVEFKMDPLNT